MNRVKTAVGKNNDHVLLPAIVFEKRKDCVGVDKSLSLDALNAKICR